MLLFLFETHVFLVGEESANASFNACGQAFPNAFLTWSSVYDPKHVPVGKLAAGFVVDGERVAVFVFVVSNNGDTFLDPNARVLTAQVAENTVLSSAPPPSIF
jgi:hypothetical protein